MVWLEQRKFFDLSENYDVVINDTDNFLASKTVDSDVGCFFRHKFLANDLLSVQAYSNFWCLARFIDYVPGVYKIRLGQKVFEPSGSFYVYAPLFTLAEIFFKSGWHKYEMLSSFKLPDPCFPKYPVIFSCEENVELQSYADIADLFHRSDVENRLIVTSAPYVPTSAKSLLDRYFREDVSISDFAKDLKMSHMTMTAGFKKQHGVTPVQYRNVLRTFEAMRLLKEKKSVTQAGLMAGFKGLTQYNQHFHRTFGVKPSAFLNL